MWLSWQRPPSGDQCSGPGVPCVSTGGKGAAWLLPLRSKEVCEWSVVRRQLVLLSCVSPLSCAGLLSLLEMIAAVRGDPSKEHHCQLALLLLNVILANKGQQLMTPPTTPHSPPTTPHFALLTPHSPPPVAPHFHLPSLPLQFVPKVLLR